MQTQEQAAQRTEENTKFCKHCGGRLPKDAVLCTHCGRQVEEIAGGQQPQVVIQNTNMNANTAVAAPGLRPKNKWVAFPGVS